jgi:NADP-dependent 3-hydroxy acid dehydrogenase YdfG
MSDIAILRQLTRGFRSVCFKAAVVSGTASLILVNNAGVMPVSPLDDLRVEDWEEMIDINIKG